ncbi:UNVERIFIED_CONTAM: hypothetical protein RMT77_005496 [Armadillidium vulgare]
MFYSKAEKIKNYLLKNGPDGFLLSLVFVTPFYLTIRRNFSLKYFFQYETPHILFEMKNDVVKWVTSLEIIYEMWIFCFLVWLIALCSRKIVWLFFAPLYLTRSLFSNLWKVFSYLVMLQRRFSATL